MESDFLQCAHEPAVCSNLTVWGSSLPSCSDTTKYTRQCHFTEILLDFVAELNEYNEYSSVLDNENSIVLQTIIMNIMVIVKSQRYWGFRLKKTKFLFLSRRTRGWYFTPFQLKSHFTCMWSYLFYHPPLANSKNSLHEHETLHLLIYGLEKKPQLLSVIFFN